jgi:hypothetical protein
MRSFSVPSSSSLRLQTWFPLQIQVYLDGHEWLARKLTARGIEHTKIDNVFARIEDLPRAQRLFDRFAHLKWPQILNRYARQVVPQLDDVLHGCASAMRAGCGAVAPSSAP